MSRKPCALAQIIQIQFIMLSFETQGVNHREFVFSSILFTLMAEENKDILCFLVLSGWCE